jgi:hypothetical protein
LPEERNSPLTFMRPVQNWESPYIYWTCVRVLFFRYLFLINCCQTLSSFSNLNNHLLRRHLFWTSKFKTPNPLIFRCTNYLSFS